MALRILPIFPFFVVNYLAGLTRISLKTFIWTTSLGMLPGSLIYASAGLQLGSINRPEDIFSAKILTALALLSFFTLLPPSSMSFRGGATGHETHMVAEILSFST